MTDTTKVPVFILAGGLGTRFSEETHLRPKPMIEIGDVPIMMHIMRWYHSFGFNDFVICAGYKSWEIKDYFLNYQFRQNNLIIDHRTNVHEAPSCQGEQFYNERWRVRVIDTGLETMTGGRLAAALDIVSKDDSFEHFAVTYGDGLADIDIKSEFHFHLEHGRIGTMLGVPPVSRFGEIAMDEFGAVQKFVEKPESRQGLINGGFFFFRSDFRSYLSEAPDLILERTPLERLVKERQLVVYQHRGFWQCMDTLRDKNYLQGIWETGNAPWKPKVQSV